MTTLPSIDRQYGPTMMRRGRMHRECWAARTRDGQWLIERQDEAGTPWLIQHLPSGRCVPSLSAPSVARLYSTLARALADIASGAAAASLGL